MERCTICTRLDAAIHYHHTIPRSRGGENSLQIPLCGSCHTQLHAAGLAVASRLRSTTKSKKPNKQFWANSEDEARAQPWLEILVKSLLTPIENDNSQHPINLSVDAHTIRLIKLLQKDLGMSNMSDAILHSIYTMANNRGLGNVAKDRTDSNGIEKSELWFLLSPGKR